MRACVLGLLLAACVPVMLHGQTITSSAPPAPINSPAFAVRPPLPGHPGYLATIKFIDDGVRYVDPQSRFFVSPTGEMCFYTGPSTPQVYTEAFYKTWCIHPYVVDRVSVIDNFGGSPHGVEMWCVRAYPACAHSIESGEIANRVYATSVVDYQQERIALQSLILMMGGYVRVSGPGFAAE
jgi:hypothetical protein